MLDAYDRLLKEKAEPILQAYVDQLHKIDEDAGSMVAYDFSNRYGALRIWQNTSDSAAREARFGTGGNFDRVTGNLTDLVTASTQRRFGHGVPPEAQRALQKALIQIREALSPDALAQEMLRDRDRRNT